MMRDTVSSWPSDKWYRVGCMVASDTAAEADGLGGWIGAWIQHIYNSARAQQRTGFDFRQDAMDAHRNPI
jgi:hypothetical protein